MSGLSVGRPARVLVLVAALSAIVGAARAHVIGDEAHDRPTAQYASAAGWLQSLKSQMLALAMPIAPTRPRPSAAALDTPPAAAAMEAAFAPFAPTVRTRSDGQYFYVESHGMPDHPMMIGITAWQQQVPIAHDYVGANAWRIPLVPKPAANPLSARSHFFRGAIALAVNGVPIFNPIKQDGRTDTFLAGELDEFGGHAGRADDYHYHIAPVFLQKTLGPAAPLAFALDGYPILGYREPDGSAALGLDAFNGHMGPDGAYHYHATPAYPYVNGGFHGEVVELEGQVDPQPVARGVRPATNPLRGAAIVGFTARGAEGYSLTYRLRGEDYIVNYRVEPTRAARFEFVDPRGKVRVEEYPSGSRPRR